MVGFLLKGRDLKFHQSSSFCCNLNSPDGFKSNKKINLSPHPTKSLCLTFCMSHSAVIMKSLF